MTHYRQNTDTGRTERTGNRNQQVSHNRSCGKRKPCHRLVRCQNPRQKVIGRHDSSEKSSTYAGKSTVWTEMGQPTA